MTNDRIMSFWPWAQMCEASFFSFSWMLIQPWFLSDLPDTVIQSIDVVGFGLTFLMYKKCIFDEYVSEFSLTGSGSSILSAPVTSDSKCCFVVQTLIRDTVASCIHRCCVCNNTEALMQLVWAVVALSPAESVTQQAFNAEWSCGECRPTVSWFNPLLLPVLTQDPLMQP